MNSNDRITEEEAILIQEPADNSYNIVEPHLLNQFPYFLMGQIRCTFVFSNHIEISEGVGMIIGSDLIITSAHNLYHTINDSDVYIYPKNIEFIPMLNGMHSVFHPIQCNHFSIPDKFKNFKKSFLNKEDGEKIIKYDYAIIFMNYDIGYDIAKIFENEMTEGWFETDSENYKLFSFFEEHITKFENLEYFKKKKLL